MTHVAVTKLRSISPYSQSRMHDEPKLDKESAEDHDIRTWRSRMHIENGKLFIPPMAFKNCIAEAAEFLSEKIKGKGQSTWSKHFRAGILVMDGLFLPDDPEKVPCYAGFMNSDGKRGSGKRVLRRYPIIPQWEGDVTWHVLDDTITEDAFKRHLSEAGKFIGIGRFRPRNGGFNGRFEVVKVKWE